jgi:DNA-binding HxlR family transcriptional regulator
MLANPTPAETTPEVDRLVQEIIGRVADKWTMLVLEILTEHEVLRFTRIADQLEGISQKMLTQTLRQMERDGLLQRTVLPVIPPHVEYRLTELGYSLGAAFCGVWMWAEKNYSMVQDARAKFDSSPVAGIPQPRVAI